ncbi:sigma 54-interacting transcriptional regulator [Lacticaseibacillus camelliae]|uniref:Protein SipR n=2 Tax=Lacticaseibacillus camelliae TaxID=381742 RepID=A0A0R2EP29_9LACO|nr:sigma 54-interacting transcriptional regulator [Lacticaseibacillus camelliae]KRN18162.1 protein SipR [Lacticaseibacillus camelliae DSM 22697 = JCM 13995]
MGVHEVGAQVRQLTEAASSLADLTAITTEAIASAVHLSRNTTSQYLNELLKAHQVLQIKSRPTYFADHEAFAAQFFVPKLDVYPSLAALEHEQTARNNVFKSFIGSDQSMKEDIDRIITALAYPPNGLPFILSGSTGVGKSYLAKLSYEYCVQEGILKAHAPFLTLNCAQYYHNPELLSSNLFGYVKGSFTGAVSDMKGMLEAADGGILFLDECHRLDPESQEKLFSFMDTGTFQRMGDTSAIRRSNVRLVFATTEDLQETFLQTFMRRIPIAVTVPNLNDRSKIELRTHIYQAFINEAKRLDMQITVSPWIINRLYNHTYKANVGELRSDVRILCARVFSQSDSKQAMTIATENIGNGLLTNLLAVNEQETIVQEPVVFTPKSVLSDYLKAWHDDNTLVKELIQKFLRLENDYQTQQITPDVVKQQLARETAALMEQMVHQDKRFENESLKYLTAVIQKLFDYLNSSFFVKIKGNAVVTIANFLYRKHDFELTLTPANEAKIEHLLALLTEHATVENQLLKAFLDLVRTQLDFRLDALNRLLLLSYLVSLELNAEETGQHALILAHGFSTASSIADVTNQFLNGKVFDAYDMPLTVSVDQVKSFLVDYVKKYDCHKGLIVLVDMGSLMVLPETLSDLLTGPLLLINNVSTQEALYVGEMIQQDAGIDEIGRRVQDKLLPQYKLTYPVIEKTPMIVTTCHTGVGSARQIEALLEHSIPASVNYKVESVDYAFLLKYQREAPMFKQYDVVAIVGTNDPKLPDVPFISLEMLFSNKGTEVVQQLFPTITDAEELASINDKLIQNLSLERLLSAVTILDVHKVIKIVGKMIERLEDSAKIHLSNNQRATLYVHISALIERLIRNDKPLEYAHVTDVEPRVQGLAQLRRALSEIETTYGVTVPEGELNYLYDIVFTD